MNPILRTVIGSVVACASVYLISVVVFGFANSGPASGKTFIYYGPLLSLALVAIPGLIIGWSAPRYPIVIALIVGFLFCARPHLLSWLYFQSSAFHALIVIDLPRAIEWGAFAAIPLHFSRKAT